MTTLLADGSLKQWYFSVSTGEPDLLNSFDEHFKIHFGNSNLEYNAEQKLKKLKQIGSASTYTSRFSELVVHVDWSESTKINQFYTNLKTATKDQISQTKCDDCPKTFNEYKKWTIDINNRVHERREEHKEKSTSKSSSTPSKNNKNSNWGKVPSLRVANYEALRIGGGSEEEDTAHPDAAYAALVMCLSEEAVNDVMMVSTVIAESACRAPTNRGGSLNPWKSFRGRPKLTQPKGLVILTLLLPIPTLHRLPAFLLVILCK
ncbi:hypothetical protein D9758_015895 [Tetrapyrgos nigripes]|uniref:Retrotransposon gag domain-containing protein n=1 Tax=Tetrapyrgos nigripes TaxID=182062 RepID=A0A8H5FP10_9AGAR|nr:hypothetical protein D9758_015895 [Tetrapyrgos nigripes]